MCKESAVGSNPIYPLQDFSSNVLVFSKYYKPVKSSIYNPLNMSVQGGKSKNARYNHSL